MNVKMKLENIARILFFLLLAVAGNGCATKALWENGDLEACRTPAEPANLRLFEAKQRNDLLVVYDEYSERNDRVRTRAYWLNENQELVKRLREPDFVNTNLSRNLQPVPLFNSFSNVATNFPIYAVATNYESFTVFSTQGINSYDLPVYNDGWGKYEKTALTPVMVVADLTIIGGVVGYYILEGMAESEQSGPIYSTTVR